MMTFALTKDAFHGHGPAVLATALVVRREFDAINSDERDDERDVLDALESQEEEQRQAAVLELARQINPDFFAGLVGLSLEKKNDFALDCLFRFIDIADAHEAALEKQRVLVVVVVVAVASLIVVAFCSLDSANIASDDKQTTQPVHDVLYKHENHPVAGRHDFNAHNHEEPLFGDHHTFTGQHMDATAGARVLHICRWTSFNNFNNSINNSKQSSAALIPYKHGECAAADFDEASGAIVLHMNPWTNRNNNNNNNNNDSHIHSSSSSSNKYHMNQWTSFNSSSNISNNKHSSAALVPYKHGECSAAGRHDFGVHHRVKKFFADHLDEPAGAVVLYMNPWASRNSCNSDSDNSSSNKSTSIYSSETLDQVALDSSSGQSLCFRSSTWPAPFLEPCRWNLNQSTWGGGMQNRDVASDTLTTVAQLRAADHDDIPVIVGGKFPLAESPTIGAALLGFCSKQNDEFDVLLEYSRCTPFYVNVHCTEPASMVRALCPLVDHPARLWQLNSSAATPHKSVIDKNGGELHVRHVGSTDEISPMRAGELDDIHWKLHVLIQPQMMFTVVLVFGLFHCKAINSKNKKIRKIKLRQAQDANRHRDVPNDGDDDDDDDADPMIKSLRGQVALLQKQLEAAQHQVAEAESYKKILMKASGEFQAKCEKLQQRHSSQSSASAASPGHHNTSPDRDHEDDDDENNSDDWSDNDNKSDGPPPAVAKQVNNNNNNNNEKPRNSKQPTDNTTGRRSRSSGSSSRSTTALSSSSSSSSLVVPTTKIKTNPPSMSQPPTTIPRCRPDAPPLFSGTVLEQILQFVLPEDVARSSMVCKTWRNELLPSQPLQQQQPPPPNDDEETNPPTGIVSNSQAIWKQAFMNSHPKVMQAIIAARGDEATQRINFHAIAKSDLGRRRKRPQHPEATLRFENVLILLELKQKVVHLENGQEQETIEEVGTFWRNGSADMAEGNFDFDLNSFPETVLEEKNPLCRDTYSGDVAGQRLWASATTAFRSSNAAPHPHGWDWHKVECPIRKTGFKSHDRLMVSITLFRCDDWRSFCLLEDVDMVVDKSWFVIGDRADFSFQSKTWPSWGERRGERQHRRRIQGRGELFSPFGRGCAGSVAHEVLGSSGTSTTMFAFVKIQNRCMLPPPGTAEEPQWLYQLRRTLPADMDEWTDQMADDIAQVKTFRFCLASLTLNFNTGNSDEDWDVGEEFDDPNAFLLLLEGLDWK
jgi:hypothetical protein